MQELITDIVMGEVPEGDWLPSEADLAANFEVSRGVAREVIRALEERGLVRVVHGRGAQVASSTKWDMFDVDVLSARLAGPHRSEVLRDFLECRQLVEIEASGLAAERADGEARGNLLAALAAMQDEARRAHSPSAESRFHRADIDFHRAIIDATGNIALAGLVEKIHAALLAARFPTARPQFRLERAMPEHERIAEAIIRGDSDAAREAMRAHLETVGTYIDAELSGTEEPHEIAPSSRD